MFEKWANVGRQLIREALGEQLARFQAVFLGGAGDSAWEPTMEEMITLSDTFHLCVAVPHKWASEMKHKCSCDTSQRKPIASTGMLFFLPESLRQRVSVATSTFVGESLLWRVPMSASPCICEPLRWFGRPLDLRSSVSPGDGETLRWQVPATASPFIGDYESLLQRVPAAAIPWIGDS